MEHTKITNCLDATKTLTPDDLKAQLKKFEQIVEEANG